MEPVAGVLYSLFRGSPAHREWVVNCLQGAWPAIVGQGIARVCRPAVFDGSGLRIAVEDPAWEDALASMRDELRERILRATGGEVRRISFFVAQPG